MNFPPRFEQALNKLYIAFHNNSLIPECCKQCAVGNILDNSDQWKHFTEAHGSLQLTYVGLVNEKFGKRYNGYSPMELLKIEATFLEGCGYTLPFRRTNENPSVDKNSLFLGLSAVVDYLCRLEEIPNVMDCVKLFDFEFTGQQPAAELVTS